MKRNRKPSRRSSSSSHKSKSLLTGLVLTVLGKGYKVDIDGECWTCRVRGRIFHGEKKTRPVVGDVVQVEPRREALQGIICSIGERRTTLARKFPETGREQILAANIDQVLVCMAIKSPPFRPGLIDRYLITCEALSLQPILVVNKVDLATEEEIQVATASFRKLGYQIVETSATEHTGIDELKELIAGKNSVFTGPSGAGKSSLTNAIEPDAQLLTGEVNDVTGKGRHTTTASQLIPFAGGFVMDTPGIREFAPWGITLEELPSCFVEFRPYLFSCQFRDCKHSAEPNCAVKEAVENGDIGSRRYQSYLQLVEELEEETKGQY
jgi:ribosome biogenesis GTPase